MRQYIAGRLVIRSAIAVLLTGCADKAPSGHWLIAPEGYAAFESGTVLPDHVYYYIGSYANPDSVIAIDRRFTLRTRVWAEADMTESLLNGWLQMFQTERYSPACTHRGGVILTPDGWRAGYWYSRNIHNIVYMPEAGVIEVYQPHAGGGRVCGQDFDSIGF
jgi:hypothetical protein